MTACDESEPELPGTRTVLVVNDAAIVRRLVYRLFHRFRDRVFEAASASEGLQVIALPGIRVDLVLRDVVMPQVSGVELARGVREVAPATRVLFMAAFPADVLLREGLHDRKVAFVLKPFTREQLLTSAAQAVAEPGPPSPASAPGVNLDWVTAHRPPGLLP